MADTTTNTDNTREPSWDLAYKVLHRLAGPHSGLQVLEQDDRLVMVEPTEVGLVELVEIRETIAGFQVRGSLEFEDMVKYLIGITKEPVLVVHQGTIKAPLARVRAMGYGLALGIHPWGDDNPQALPSFEGDFDEIKKAVQDEVEKGWHEADDVEDFWLPRVTIQGDVLTWRPWNNPDDEGRKIVLNQKTGEVSWKVSKDSTFVGDVLTALVGLDALHGIVELR